ncbi:hypothetical protein AB205_0036160 [Aquarana catesbeiana]|uniref:Uncharacterized protein n=1 Tax=Aquarana catesbeiana TaxID=8400 RepID=A0A2G9SKS6_AQUCT|nr:hypothetical protein AB205_0036160 [Aquarana catesbeiana]
MALTYDPTAAIQNGFYSPPYNIATNRMIPQTSITPFIAASPVSTYQGGPMLEKETKMMWHPPQNPYQTLILYQTHIQAGSLTGGAAGEHTQIFTRPNALNIVKVLCHKSPPQGMLSSLVQWM